MIDAHSAEGREAVRSFEAHRSYLQEQAAVNDRLGQTAISSVERLRCAGLLGVSAPKPSGGLGLTSLHDVSLLVKEIAAADGSVGVALSMHFALAVYFARTIAASDDADLVQREWLRELGSGAMVLASAVAEPGLEAWRPATEARQDADGWTVSGRKTLVSNSPSATHLYTRVRCVGPGGTRMGSAMIPVAAHGVEVLDDWDGLGLRGSGSGTVILDDVRVPDRSMRRGGPWGRPDPDDLEGRAAASIPIVAAYLGIAQAASDIALAEFARDSPGARRRSEATAIRWYVADMTVAYAEAEAVFQRSLERIDEVFASTPPRSADPKVGRRIMRECLIASLAVERETARVIDAAMQICGGRAFTADHPLARCYRDAKAAAFMRPFSPPERFVEFLLPGSTEA
ncbi:acyl-CoA dehydrogenase family protein [Curtobacterium flaccumfaciens]|uniref:acyl-CoA dehydrogenase family protein n=1 Tax=Curtobacterium flaccumfaciens TaxID=2035 RepID=UPI00112C0F42|nr:acyl-CoA dehydrogenase family protein [Curtobacterium flaccumfaciens]TPG05127.1 acyl-CoA dehydrogenase [Curtobacterium flaccumfaciens]